MRSGVLTRVAAAWLVVACTTAVSSAEYVPPTYPQHEFGLESIGVRVPDRVAADGALELRVSGRFDRVPDETPRLFAHFIRDGAVYHVESLEADQSPAAGTDAELGTLRIPASLPPGKYRVQVGVYGERETAEADVTVEGPAPDRQPIIINTGVFTDKHGVPHRWHVNKAHTLFWNGRPFMPVGGMMIPDSKIEVFKSQIDLLVKNNVRDVYFNVGSSVMMPHTWETKSDEQLRLFQACVDYMDEKGVRYGMELSGLQAHGYGYDLTGGGDFEFDVKPDGEMKLLTTGDNQWIEDGKLNVYYHKTNDALYLISDRQTGEILAHGRASLADESREGKQQGPEHKIVRIDLSGLANGAYKAHITPSRRRDRWNDNMHFWNEDTQKYYDKIRELYSVIRMGPGFRFIVDAFWNENNTDHNIVPAEERFRTAFQAWLESRYGTIAALNAAWAVAPETPVTDFKFAASLLPARWVDDADTGVTWLYLIHPETNTLIRCRHDSSQHRYDVHESIGHQLRDFHNEVADLFKEMHNVPVIFKYFSGMDRWHINDAGIAGGFDGLGMESYGVGEPMLTFMGIPAYGQCAQATKTMWLIVTEVGEGHHQDQSLSRNKLLGCTSRLGTMYPIYASLMSGGAKGVYHYYMMPSPGADQFWGDAVARDPRQLEWLGTFADAVEHAPGLVDYTPKVYYRFPGLPHPNSGLLFSDPYRDFFNTDVLWWVDPAGKLPNGAWLLPTFTLDVETDMVLINLENKPATLRYADEATQAIRSGRRVTWLGYRKDRGTIPAVDLYYTDAMAVADDGIKFQVLAPTPTSRVIGRNRDGQVWNLIDGSLQIISKSAENCPGWRPDRLVLDDENYAFDYEAFMSSELGIEMQPAGEGLEQFTYIAGDDRVTVVSLAADRDARITMGDQLSPYEVDATGNVVAPPTMEPVPVRVELPDGYAGRVSKTYAGGMKVSNASDGGGRVNLEPDDLTLINSERKYEWAPEGLLFDSLDSKAAVIVRTAASASALPPAVMESSADQSPTATAGNGGLIVIEASEPTERSNFNLNVFSGLTELGCDALLGLASSCPPPAPDGYTASYAFEVQDAGTYQFWVREGYLAMASPMRWRIDDGPWQEGSNRYVPVDVRLAAQYNALEDERMIFAWYHYANVDLTAGKHRLTCRVVDKRPGGLDIGLANTMSYGVLLDQFVLSPRPLEPSGRTPGMATDHAGALPEPRINLIANPSLEQDIGGWAASRWTDGRWSGFELRDDHGWDHDFWWTRKAGAAGRLRIKGLTDIGGLTIRSSYAGVRSLRIRAGDQPRRFAAAPVAVQAGERIAFGGFVRVEQLPSGAQFRLRLLDRHGNDVELLATEPVVGTTHWQQQAAEEAVVPDGAVMAVFECYVPATAAKPPEGHPTAWFDDVYVYVTSTN